MLNAKIMEKELVDIFNISGFTDNSDLDKKIAALATKSELKADQVKIVKIKYLIPVISVVKVIKA